MHASLRSALVVVLLALASCETGSPLGPTAGRPARTGGPYKPDEPKASVDAAATVVVVADAGAATPDAPIVEAGGEPITCASLAAGGTPDRMKAFQWQYEVPSMTAYQPPYETVAVEPGCLLIYRKVIESPKANTFDRSVAMSAADCAAVRGWVTNARFLHVLRTGENCPFGDGNPDDVLEVTLTDEGRFGRKTYLCPEPTVEAVRSCLRPLVARLFPS